MEKYLTVKKNKLVKPSRIWVSQLSLKKQTRDERIHTAQEQLKVTFAD